MATLEFALIWPAMLLLVFGIIEFGQTLNAQHLVLNGAREGARRAALPGATDALVQQAIDNYMNSVGIRAGYTRTIVPSSTTAKTGDAITVTIRVPYTQICAMPDMVGLRNTMITGKVIMRKE